MAWVARDLGKLTPPPVKELYPEAAQIVDDALKTLEARKAGKFYVAPQPPETAPELDEEADEAEAIPVPTKPVKAKTATPAAQAITDLEKQTKELFEKRSADADGISETSVDNLEQWLGERITVNMLGYCNTHIATRGRRKITMREIAAIAAVHRVSVKENSVGDIDELPSGESPIKRFVSLANAKNHGVFSAPVDHIHVSAALQLLTIIGFTKLTRQHDKKTNRAAAYWVSPEAP